MIIVAGRISSKKRGITIYITDVNIKRRQIEQQEYI
jgi:hypothetical protein